VKERIEQVRRVGYNALSWEELEPSLQRRYVTTEEIDRVVRLLNAPDATGLFDEVTREDVGTVAVYLSPEREGIIALSALWDLMVQEHPATRAFYYHEWVEIRSYELFTSLDPLSVSRPSEEYSIAHARACLLEAQYWEAWAAAEGETIRWQAFLRGHPLRHEEEIEELLDILEQDWDTIVEEVDTEEVRAARRFYESKQVSRQGMRL
jgi:hypothetical protein